MESEVAGYTLWLTGLSGSGKSTIAKHLKLVLEKQYFKKCIILDGDIIRNGLNKDLGFSQKDREENIRRISEVAKLFNMSGFIVIVSFISPYSIDREKAIDSHKQSGLAIFEIFINSSLEICEERDVKGLYKKARIGEIPNFTGISDKYDIPHKPDFNLKTENISINESIELMIEFLKKSKIIQQGNYNSSNVFPQTDEINLKINDNSLEIICDYEDLNLLQTIQQGWCAPIHCFMNEEQLIECLYFKTYSSNEQSYLQTIPIIFPVSDDVKDYINQKTGITIIFINSITKEKVAILENTSTYAFKKPEFCAKVFGTSSINHPKINKYYSQGNHLLTGSKLTFISKINFNDGLDLLRLDCSSIKNIKQERNHDIIFAFQIRNPLHNGHLLLLEEARKQLIEKGYKNPLLLLHPCGGWTKEDDVPLDVRIRQHKILLEENEVLKESSLLAIWPSPMYYAGPLEVLWHFRSRELAEVDYMIVGRDPAGIKNPENPEKDLYDPFDGQKLIDLAFRQKKLKIKSIPFKTVFYNRSTKQMEFYDKKNEKDYENISGTKMRQLARENKSLPDNFMNKNAWQVLSDYYNK